jgi:hypothetical protein
MSKFSPTVRRFALLAAPLLAAGCAAVGPAAQGVPDPLRPGPGETLARIVPAQGVQIYQCRARADNPAAFEWAFVAPEAELLDTKGRRIGRHYAGPHWEALDGSRVAGTVKARADAPYAGTIPWLLLAAKSAGPTGDFSAVTSIQRINTVGGAAPQTPCTAATAGRSARVDYRADYYFYAAR